MYIILKNETGGTTEGVILAAGRNVMRVSLRGLSDTVELRLSDGTWTAGGGDKFELDALVADTDQAMSDLGSALRARTLTAGMQFFG
jgi:hypothetical protein